VPATATPEEIRQAYRAAARRQHPDAAGPGSDHAMAALNEAYFVLSDPGRRAIYDASLTNRRPPAPTPMPFAAGATPDLDDDEGFVPLRHPAARFGIPLPWIVVLGALALIFVFTAYAVRPKSSPSKIDGTIELGSCVAVAAVGTVRETSCGGPNEGRVVAVPPSGSYCQDGTEAFVDASDNRVVCVRRT
jgi:molecular chaperone DnaJ